MAGVGSKVQQPPEQLLLLQPEKPAVEFDFPHLFTLECITPMLVPIAGRREPQGTRYDLKGRRRIVTPKCLVLFALGTGCRGCRHPTAVLPWHRGVAAVLTQHQSRAAVPQRAAWLGEHPCHSSKHPPSSCPLATPHPPEKLGWVHQAILSLPCSGVISIYFISVCFQDCRR